MISAIVIRGNLISKNVCNLQFVFYLLMLYPLHNKQQLRISLHLFIFLSHHNV